MKKTLQLFLLVFISLNISAQVSAPNGNFENWTTTNFENPQGFFSNNWEFIQNELEPGIVKSTDAYHGSFALQISTYSPAYVSMTGNYSPNNPPPWNGGFPYSETPTGIRGFYKSDIPVGDSAIMLVNFSKNGSAIGAYIKKFAGTNTSYTAFDFAFDPPLPMAPDSVIVFFVSSDVLNEFALPGTTITFDSLSFTGVASQPALFDGDFENWETIGITGPDSWYQFNDGTNTVLKTTDKVEGNFAAELITYLRESDTGLRAEGQRLSTKYWDNECDCEMGGYPYSQQIDTFSFWYKYIPSGLDTAYVSIIFKKDGITFDGRWEHLYPASEYTLVQIPINLSQVPDSVGIEFSSSVWYDSLPSFAGSNLKIDEAQFLSQPLTTGITSSKFVNGISVFPNPGNGLFNFFTGVENGEIEILNITGQRVFYTKNLVKGLNVVDIQNQPSGVYLYRVYGNNKIAKTGKLIIN